MTARRHQLRAAAWSYARVFAAGVLVAFLASGQRPSEVTLADAWLLLDAGIGALLLTAANALRTGERRFGRGADVVDLAGDGSGTALEPLPATAHPAGATPLT